MKIPLACISLLKIMNYKFMAFECNKTEKIVNVHGCDLASVNKFKSILVQA
jgi:hypothetical protein